MKQNIRLIPMFLVFLFILTSCTDRSDKILEPVRNTELEMTAEKDGMEFVADVFLLPDGNISISFTSPEMMQGFKIKTDETGYAVDAYGIKDIIPYTDVYDNSYISLIFSTLKALIYTNHTEFTSTDDGYKIDFALNKVNIKAEFDKEGYLLKAIIPKEDFSAEFTHNQSSKKPER